MDNSMNFEPNARIRIEFPCDNVEAEYGHPRSMGSVPEQIEVNQDGYNNIPAPSTDQFATVVEQLIAIGQSQTTKGDGNQPADSPGTTVVEQLVAIGQLQTTEGDGNQPADIPGTTVVEQLIIGQSQTTEDDGNQPADIPGNQSSTSDNEDVPESLKQQIICDQCGQIFYSRSGFKTHIAVVHKGYKCTCKICGATMKYPTNLIIHMRVIHKIGEPPSKKNINRVCPKCSKKFTSNYLMFHHLKTVHKVAKPHECSLCRKVYRTSVELSAHKGTHQELAPYVCNICSHRYRTKIYLEKHREKCGRYETPNSYSRIKNQCQKCKKDFTTLQSYKYHVSNIEGTCSRNDNRNICKCCGQVFENKSDLKDHFISEHKVSKTREAMLPSKTKKPCPVCKKLLYLNGIKYHAKLHAGVKPHKCDQCDYRAILSKDIAKHKRHVHNIERLYACQICSRKFFSRHDEKAHMDFHFGSRCFECKVCQKTYTSKSGCNHHEKLCKIGMAGTQLSVNPKDVVAFRCRWCGAMYSIKSMHTKHAKTCALKGGTEYEVRNKEDLEKAFDEMQQRSQEDQADKQVCEKQELGKQECRPDFLPWCKVCSGIFKDHRSFKYHNNSCGVGNKKERAKRRLGTEENSSDDDDELTETKPRSIKIGKTPKPNRRTSPRKRNEQNQRVRHAANDEIFSPFSFSCEVCGKATEELIKEFCPEHYTFCSFCDKSLKYDENLKMHFREHLEMQEESESDDAVVCKTCRKTTEELVVAHISKHPYHCLKCKLAFTAKNQLCLHNREHRIQVVYRCEKCTETFTNRVKFKRHLQEHVNHQQLGPITRTHVLRSTLIMPSEADQRILALGHITQPLVEQDLDAVSVNFSSPSQIINNVQTRILPMKSLERRQIQMTVKSDPDGAETIAPVARQSTPGSLSSSTTPEGSTPTTSNADNNLQKTPSGVLFQSSPGASSSSTTPEGSTPSIINKDANLQKAPSGVLFQSAPGASSCNTTPEGSTPSTSNADANLQKTPSGVLFQSAPGVSSSSTAPGGITPSTSNADTNLQKTPYGVPFQCPHCPKTFSIERNLHVHMRSEMPFPCSFCILSYKTKFGYDMHLKDKHMDIWKLIYMQFNTQL